MSIRPPRSRIGAALRLYVRRIPASFSTVISSFSAASPRIARRSGQSSSATGLPSWRKPLFRPYRGRSPSRTGMWDIRRAASLAKSSWPSASARITPTGMCRRTDSRRSSARRRCSAISRNRVSRSRTRRSASIRGVTSWKVLMATRCPSASTAARACSSDHRSIPSARRKPMSVGSGSSPPSTRRPGSIVGSKGSPASSISENCATRAPGVAASICSGESNPAIRAATSLTKRSRPDGSWTLIPALTPDRTISRSSASAGSAVSRGFRAASLVMVVAC